MKPFASAPLAAAALLFAFPAQATQFVVNGGFENVYGMTGSGQISSDTGTQHLGYTDSNGVYQGWTNCSTGTACTYGSGTGQTNTAGYNMLVNNGGSGGTTIDTNGIQTNDNGAMYLWGQAGHIDTSACSGATSGCSTTLSVSQTGGNFLAADGAYQTTAIQQTLRGLVVGQTYDLTFSYAGAQQYNYTGTTTEGWKVSWTDTGNSSKSSTFTTPTLNDASHGFTGWQQVTTTFTATNTSEILSFLAAGTPDGKPPFSLLDGVSVTEHAVNAVPEPAAWATFLLGFGMIGQAMRRRRSQMA